MGAANRRLRIYCDAVFVAGAILTLLIGGSDGLHYIGAHPLEFGVLAGGVLLGEMLPLKIPRRGGDEEITLSTSFALALLLAGGLLPAVLVQGAASIVQDRLSGKPWWRVRFNIGQYTLCMVGALGVVMMLGSASSAGLSHPFAARQLPAVLAAAATFFVLNNGLVGIAVGWYQGTPLSAYFRRDVTFVVVTGGVMLMLSPLVIAASAYSPFLVPLFMAPILAMYNTVWQGARSDHQARHDSLTGLPNRLDFHDAVESQLREAAGPASVLLIDLDRFKDVNDTLGHHYGDMLLREVAERFRDALGPDDHIARFGGDEFAILGRGRDASAGRALAAEVAAALAEPFELEQMVVDAQASIGIAVLPGDGSDVATLLQKADIAMYRAKDTRAGITLYEEAHDNHSPARLELTARLRRAIDEEEIVVWYQPQLDLESDQVMAVEALVRWEHPHLGLLLPDAFIEIAEHTNLIKPLTQRVLRLALGQAAQWRGLGLDIPVAVNISVHVLADPGFVERVLAALSEARVPPRALKLEVTESTLMSDPALARNVLLALEAHGIQIAIDDFGTGYSSLAYLADLPVSEVKIDRSFVSRMETASRETIIVNSTITLAHQLGLRAVAEGVEGAARLDELRALGADAAQGYAISPPLPAPQVTEWMLASGAKPRLAAA